MLGYAIFALVITGTILLLAASIWADIDASNTSTNSIPDINAGISNAVASSSADGHPATDAIDGNTTSFWES